MSLKKKDAEGKVASKIIKQILRQHFKIAFLKEEMDQVMADELQKLMESA